MKRNAQTDVFNRLVDDAELRIESGSLCRKILGKSKTLKIIVGCFTGIFFSYSAFSFVMNQWNSNR